MEEVPHCVHHHKRVVEYMCLTCMNLPMCETCKLEHEDETRHASEDCKEVGLGIMHQCIKNAGARLVKELAKGLRNAVKEFEAGLLREINRFQLSCAQTDEKLCKMQKLDNEGRYAELYFYAKMLPAGGAENEAAMGELKKQLLEMLDKASNGLKKVLSKIAVAKKYKPGFAAYKKDEVLCVLEGGSYKYEEEIVSVLHSADMSKCNAIYIDFWYIVGDSVASELASRLQTHPVSALYLSGRKISDAGAEILTQAAFCCKSLSAFCINGDRISDTGAKAVAEAARNSRSLATFYLGGDEISDSGATAVAEVVKGCLLSVFYLHSFRITDAGAKAVADAMKSCLLSIFYLGGSEISDAGATVVADAMKSCSLSAFCLWSNGMSGAGAIAVAKTMKDCPLSAFYLMSDGISDPEALAVAKILSNGECANTLSALFLESTSISDLGARAMADAVRGCPRLSAFYLRGNPISGETVAYILEDMAGISTIRSVNLNLCEVSKEQMDSFLNRLQQSGVARQLKLRFEYHDVVAVNRCLEFIPECIAKLAEFDLPFSITSLFNAEVILGVQR